jgi:hypothetical protein
MRWSAKALFTLAAVLLPLSALADSTGMNGLLIGRAQNLVSGQTGYEPLVADGNNPWNGTESSMRQVMPIAGTVRNFRVCLSGASGSGTRTFTIRKNAADTAVVVAVTATTCNQDLSHTFNFVPGDLLDVKQVTTGTLNSVTIYWSTWVTAANTNEYPLLMTSINNVSAGATRFHDLQGDGGGAFTEQFMQAVFPTGCTASSLYAKADGNATTSSIDITFRKGNADSTLTASIAAGTDSANDTTHTVALSAGNIVSVKMINNGSVDRRVTVGIKCAPTNDGESVAMSNSASNLNQGSTQFSTVMGGSNATNATEATVQQMVQAATLKTMAGATFGNVGGSGQTSAINLQVNGTPSALTCSVATGAKACTDVTHNVTTANDDLVDFSLINSASTGTTQTYAGIVIALPTNTPVPTNTPTPTPTPTSTPTPAGNPSQHLGLLGAG